MKQEKVGDAVFVEARDRLKMIFEGKSPEPMDVKSYDLQIERKLAESVNILIKSFMQINDFQAKRRAVGEHAKCVDFRGAVGGA